MHLLVIRTSAMGDMALLTPVISGMRKQHPDIEVTLVTRSAFAPFFYSISGLNLILPDFKKKHKGVWGIFRLYCDIKKHQRIDHVIDLHDVLRSRILRCLFRLTGVHVSVINKGRKEKSLVIDGKKKVQLKHSVERYCDVFAEAGFPVIPGNGPWLIPTNDSLKKVADSVMHNMLNIGVAPFARHKLKVWPEENMVTLLSLISGKHKVKFWLFGGSEDIDMLKAFQEKVPGSFITAGNLALEEEIALMRRLDLMIAMDSSNMHMAALAGTKVISIWGGTDPLIGFGAWQQPENYSVRIPVEELTCRPCTVFGKGKCRRGDFACMKWLKPEDIFDRIEEQVNFFSPQQ